MNSAWNQTGKCPPQLEPFEFPAMLSNIWEWFIELNDGRSYGMDGAHPLTFTVIKDWSELMGVRLEPREIRVIKKLDNLLLKANR